MSNKGDSMGHFWDVTAANIISWLLLAIGFIGTQYVTTKLLVARMDSFERWVTAHEKKSSDRDDMLTALQVSTAKLTTISEIAEKRLERMEDNGQPHRFIRSENPEPYYGPERRRRDR